METFGHQRMFIVIIVIIAYICQLETAVGVSNGCSDVCDYNAWGKAAYCEGRNLELVPQECQDAKTLHMQRNRVTHICTGTFKNFTGLKYLFLDRNNLSIVERGAFQGCRQIETVHLSDNFFPSVTLDMMEGLSSVANMHIDRANVKRVQTLAFQNLTRLKLLSLQENRLLSPPCYAFTQDNTLESLYLSSNTISELPNDCFAMFPHLVKLFLKNNPLLHPNPLAFRGLNLLIQLDLQYTNLTQVPTGIFSYVNTIRILYLSFNNIRHLSNRDFVSLPGLTKLYLQHNQLLTIHEQSFQYLSNLRILDLSHNQLQSIGEDALESCSGLEQLHLHNNQLPTTRNITFSHLGQLSKLYLANNPLRCDCAISPLQFWLANADNGDEQAVSELRMATCTSPSRFAGQLVSQLDHNDICQETPVDNKPNHPIADTTSDTLPDDLPLSNEALVSNIEKNVDNPSASSVSDVTVIAIAVGVTAFLIMLMGMIALSIMKRPRPPPHIDSIDKKSANIHGAQDPTHDHLRIVVNPLIPDLPPRPQVYERTLTPTSPPPLNGNKVQTEDASYMTIGSDASGGPSNPIHPAPPPVPPSSATSSGHHSWQFPDSSDSKQEYPVENWVKTLDLSHGNTTHPARNTNVHMISPTPPEPGYVDTSYVPFSSRRKPPEQT